MDRMNFLCFITLEKKEVVVVITIVSFKAKRIKLVN